MVLEKIRQVYPRLTRSQKKLADLVANSYQEAAFMTASQMARRLGVNEATVIRFAQRLGYEGYPQLIRDVRAVVQEELQARGEGEALSQVAEPFLTSLESELDVLQRAMSHVSRETAGRLVALLQGNRRIYVVGQGVSYHLAGLLADRLAVLGLVGRALPGDPQSVAMAIADLENSDLLIAISAAHDSPEVARGILAARERGARTLAVTCSPVSEMAQAADLALICVGGDLLTVPSVAVVATFLDALIQALAGLDPARVQRCGQAMEHAARAVRGQ